jgi:hypothetical protein
MENIYPMIYERLYNVCCEKLVWDDEFYLQQKDIPHYLNMDNIMDLSYLFYLYFEEKKLGTYDNCYHIYEKMVLTDDSPFEDVILYHNAYLFIYFIEIQEYFMDMISKCIILGKEYKKMQEENTYDMFVLQQSFRSIRL